MASRGWTPQTWYNVEKWKILIKKCQTFTSGASRIIHIHYLAMVWISKRFHKIIIIFQRKKRGARSSRASARHDITYWDICLHIGRFRAWGGGGAAWGRLPPPFYSKNYWFWEKMIRDKSIQNHHFTLVWSTLEVCRIPPEDFRAILKKLFHGKQLFTQVLGENF